ncbi:dethiobiotin synthase [Rothia kristinae]|uniref:dethiobiotin synthase n=1 Tax=Rothia kristinae TaxID=37923 RepID=UPI0009E1DE64|nr:dethiobiotin synthase [Rothia kristinae]
MSTTSSAEALPQALTDADPAAFLDADAVREAAAEGLLFVTGTDTGVGKTYASAALAALLAGQGLDVHIHKPAQTGLIAPDDPEREALEARYSDVVVRGDAQIAGELAGVSHSTGFALRLPLAPGAAAEAAGVVPPTAAEQAGRILRLRERHDVVLVEGAGGILVDLGGHTLADIARACGAGALVVVCRPGLGTLNHTDLTVEAITARGLRTAGVVIGAWDDPPQAVNLSNRDALAARHRLLGAVPRGWRGAAGAH